MYDYEGESEYLITGSEIPAHKPVEITFFKESWRISWVIKNANLTRVKKFLEELELQQNVDYSFKNSKNGITIQLARKSEHLASWILLKWESK